jgi:hypothetical protein
MTHQPSYLLKEVDELRTSRYSRFSDLTVFGGSLLFDQEIKPTTLRNLQLFRLEVLIAVLFNEQLAIPQTVYISSILGQVFWEMQESLKVLRPESLKELPLVFKQPFRPALANNYINDSRGVFAYHIDRINEDDHKKGFFVELDYPPENISYQKVRSLTKKMCESISNNERNIDDDELVKMLGENGPKLYSLLKSYTQSQPLAQISSTISFGKRFRSEVENPNIRDAILNSCSSHNQSIIAKFIDYSIQNDTLLSRGPLREDPKYDPFRDAINEDIIDFINFTFHYDIQQRINAGYSNIEVFPDEKTVKAVLAAKKKETINLSKKRKETINSYDQFIYEGEHFSAVSPRWCNLLNEDAWIRVWNGLARTVSDTDWREMIVKLKRIPYSQNKKEFSKSAEEITNYLIRKLDQDDYIKFNFYEPDKLGKLLATIQSNDPRNQIDELLSQASTSYLNPVLKLVLGTGSEFVVNAVLSNLWGVSELVTNLEKKKAECNVIKIASAKRIG